MENYFCTCADVAKILNSKVSTIRTYCKKGKLPAIRVGRGYRISKRDLERWMNSNKESVSADEVEGVQAGYKGYKVLFESASDAIMICDLAGHINLVNPRFCHLLGYSQQEVQDTHFSKLIHPGDLAKTVESFMKTIAGDQDSKNLEIRMRAKNNEMLFISINTNALYQEDEISGIQAIIRDFTEEKKAENKIMFLASMLEQSADAFIGIDDNRRIIYVNPATLKMFGYRAEEMMGKDIGIMHASNKVEEEKEHITATVTKEGVWTGEILNKRASGEPFWCWATVNRIDDKEGNLTAYTAVVKETNKEI